MPTPRPEMLVTFSAVEKPGRKISRPRRAFVELIGLLGGDQALLDALAFTFCGIDAAAIVGDLDD
jgi:hypothetical protein